jgi:hypothetical protein
VNAKDGLILWTLGAAGTLLIYSAYKNNSPAETLKGYFTNTPPASSSVSRNYDIKGPGYTTQLNSDGVDTRTFPTAYQGVGKNYIPLRGARPF